MIQFLFSWWNAKCQTRMHNYAYTVYIVSIVHHSTIIESIQHRNNFLLVADSSFAAHLLEIDVTGEQLLGVSVSLKDFPEGTDELGMVYIWLPLFGREWELYHLLVIGITLICLHRSWDLT